MARGEYCKTAFPNRCGACRDKIGCKKRVEYLDRVGQAGESPGADPPRLRLVHGKVTLVR
jgi:hypothetical protein